MNSFMPGIEINSDAVGQQADDLEQQLQQNADLVKQNEVQAEQDTATADKENTQLDDPRSDGVGLNVADITTELGAALGGGFQDTASSIATAPERFGDMLNGEMEAAGDDWKPEWDPTGADGENKIETKTWWGGLLRGTVHFGTMAAGTVLAAKGIAVAAGAAGLAGVAGAAGWVAGGGKAAGLVNGLARGAVLGGISDLGSKYSQDQNALGQMRDHYNWLDTPISTKDTDHPAMMTFKNVVEGMGIGIVFDGLGFMLGKGIKKVKNAKGEVVDVPSNAKATEDAIKRSESVKEQVETRGKEQFNEEGFGAYKNEPISDPWQGSPTSTGKADVAYEQLRRTRNEWGAEMGSTTSVTTPAELNRYVQSSGLDDELIEKVAKDLMTSERFDAGMKEIKAGRATPKEIWGESVEMYQEIVQGRNIADVSTDEFLDVLMKGSYTKEGVELMSPSKVAATDLVIGSLVREARDLGLVGRELGDIADLGAKDGPAEQLVDKMVTLLTETKKARYDWSASGKELAAGVVAKPSKSLKREGQQILKDLKQESKEAIFGVLKLANKDTDDTMMKALFEYVSQSNELRNFEDLEGWARRKLKGGQLEGKAKETGKLVDELSKVMVHSVLSGPKTPVRAIMGTSSATFLRPLSTALGAALGGNGQVARASLANLNAMVQMIPEAFSLFKSKVNSSFAGNINSDFNRYVEGPKAKDAVEWELMGKFYESDAATAGEKYAWQAANIARNMNSNKLLTYSTKLMQATDETFKQLMARGQARQMAMMDAMRNGTEITPQLMKEYEAKFQAQIIDADGTIRDTALDYGTKEVTLTKQLDGFASALDDAFQKTPWAKPFFLFARTSVNGLELMGKHTPIVNRLIKENVAIRSATTENLESVAKYGITNPDQLANAKALIEGRTAIGYGVVTMATMAAMSGNLRGNGPTDRRMRQVWKDAGWKANTVKIGDVWVNFEAFEPFNVMLTTIADISDHSQLMGEEWTKDQFQKISLIVASGVTSKSYMAGLQQFVDLVAGDPKAFPRIVAGLANNTVPLSSLRNEIGKVLSPGMRELSSSIGDQIRNRNQGSELLAGDALPIKYDMLSGKPIKEWDLPTKLFNMVSPIQFNLDETPGRKMLFESQYDMRMSVMSAPSKPPVSLRDNAVLRSMFQRSLGNQGLDATLNRIAARPEVKLEMKRMNADRDKPGYSKKGEPMDYLHNRLIKRAFDRARKKAWADIAKDPRVQDLIEEQRKIDRINYNTKTGNRSGRQEALKDLQTMHK